VLSGVYICFSEWYRIKQSLYSRGESQQAHRLPFWLCLQIYGGTDMPQCIDMMMDRFVDDIDAVIHG